MARSDALGMFWEDVAHVRPPPKEKVLVRPPEPVWLSPDYLPYLAESLAFNVPLYSDEELINAQVEREILVFDIECYINYFLIAFKGTKSGKVIYFEMWQNGAPLNIGKLQWVLLNFVIVGFNSASYDIPMATLALQNLNCNDLKRITNRIINEDARPGDLYREFKIKALPFNHIDLIEVAPLTGSLKIYGGRMFTAKMQDLPFPHDLRLTGEQIAIVRFYCVNDLQQTEELLSTLWEQLELRKSMSHQYGVDLRSKSDAQIAEAVIKTEVERITGQRAFRPTFDPDATFKYKVPHFIRYRTEQLTNMLEVIKQSNFYLADSGSVRLPSEIGGLDIQINKAKYTMGIGGLHSCEKKAYHLADEKYLLRDCDVTSYYPMIILILELFPAHLGRAFLRVFKTLVDRRINAKRDKLAVIADALKIVINGSFGKLGSKWSVLFSPDLMIQVTITGQLSLLMLIEALELTGFEVISANTDGVVSKVERSREAEYDAICKDWQARTKFNLEYTDYLAVYSRDVNNYIAVKTNSDTKNKGAFYAPMEGEHALKKNPVNIVCIDAVCEFLTKGTPIAHTVMQCDDVRKFVTVRNVTGGGVKLWGDGSPNSYLGKACRWYIADGESGNIVYAKSGKKVPKTEGAVPLMQLSKVVPLNVDYAWYIAEAESMLKDLGLDL